MPPSLNFRATGRRTGNTPPSVVRGPGGNLKSSSVGSDIGINDNAIANITNAINTFKENRSIEDFAVNVLGLEGSRLSQFTNLNNRSNARQTIAEYEQGQLNQKIEREQNSKTAFSLQDLLRKSIGNTGAPGAPGQTNIDPTLPSLDPQFSSLPDQPRIPGVEPIAIDGFKAEGLEPESLIQMGVEVYTELYRETHGQDPSPEMLSYFREREIREQEDDARGERAEELAEDFPSQVSLPFRKINPTIAGATKQIMEGKATVSTNPKPDIVSPQAQVELSVADQVFKNIYGKSVLELGVDHPTVQALVNMPIDDVTNMLGDEVGKDVLKSVFSAQISNINNNYTTRLQLGSQLQSQEAAQNLEAKKQVNRFNLELFKDKIAEKQEDRALKTKIQEEGRTQLRKLGEEQRKEKFELKKLRRKASQKRAQTKFTKELELEHAGEIAKAKKNAQLQATLEYQDLLAGNKQITYMKNDDTGEIEIWQVDNTGALTIIPTGVTNMSKLASIHGFQDGVAQRSTLAKAAQSYIDLEDNLKKLTTINSYITDPENTDALTGLHEFGRQTLRETLKWKIGRELVRALNTFKPTAEITQEVIDGLKKYEQFLINAKQLFFNYRKILTGLAGSDLEMTKIQESFFDVETQGLEVVQARVAAIMRSQQRLYDQVVEIIGTGNVVNEKQVEQIRRLVNQELGKEKVLGDYGVRRRPTNSQNKQVSFQGVSDRINKGLGN